MKYLRLIKNLIKKMYFGYSNSDEFIGYLRKRGVTIGKQCKFYEPQSITIDNTRPFSIIIGNNVKITQNVTILTHGFDWCVIKELTGEILGSFGEVIIGNNVFVGIGSTILKNVHIGDNVIIGAGSVVTHDCNSNSVYAGNPARFIMSIEDYIQKRRAAQIDEAISLVKSYKKKYGYLPEISQFDEFFYLFFDRSKDLIKDFDRKLEIGGNYQKSKEIFMTGSHSMFNSFEDFLNYLKMLEI